MLTGTVYLPGDNVLITDIGESNFAVVSDPLSSLVCVTTNVNTQCCRTSDGGNVGEWFFPNGSMVPRHRTVGTDDAFSRSSYVQQVRLNRLSSVNAVSPTGAYECRVPDSNGTLQLATIVLGEYIIITKVATYDTLLLLLQNLSTKLNQQQLNY